MRCPRGRQREGGLACPGLVLGREEFARFLAPMSAEQPADVNQPAHIAGRRGRSSIDLRDGRISPIELSIV